MLVLGARIGERIYVGDTVVKVCRIASNGQIRLGFDAPSEIQIERERVRNKRLQITKGKETHGYGTLRIG
jgi:carbon storage regulator CsrA